MKKLSTLLVEDDQDQIVLYKARLTAAGFAVEVAHNGVEGLKSLGDNAPDVIISDIMMPEMDGVEFIKAVRADTRFAQIPIVVLTAITDFEHDDRLVNELVDDICEKTLRWSVFLERLEAVLKGKGLR